MINRGYLIIEIDKDNLINGVENHVIIAGLSFKEDSMQTFLAKNPNQGFFVDTPLYGFSKSRCRSAVRG